jgi:hypothetical protein
MAHTMIKVTVQSSTSPPIDQEIAGRQSTLSSDIEEFRGIPYGIVPQRWENSHLRDRLPSDTFDATRDGQVFPRLAFAITFTDAR